MNEPLEQRGMIVLAGLLCVLIALFVLLPVDFMNSLLLPMNQWLERHIPDMDLSAGKLGHTLAFFLLALCTLKLRARYRFHWLWLIGAMVAFSICTELMQLLTDGRTTRFRDLLFDLAGVGLAILCFALAGLLTDAARSLKRWCSTSNAR